MKVYGNPFVLVYLNVGPYKKFVKPRQVSCMTTCCVGFYTEVVCNICHVPCVLSGVPQRNVVDFTFFICTIDICLKPLSKEPVKAITLFV
jgi:hypothetical protein